ncbi:uncharacterized protein si:ch211-248a14.8 isoform X12 [Micropterus dolomieu]|uniref:uncharacterized protein si:ch211-248a14.8 isoform X12 n=1 Tax=Micropterus dolomieu TaxID=147949 RepID=UPI001E8E1FA4|nr:uncharacterized protein si:ch211-248a14.8 isoform X12 [Micropterus dolomieu]
MWLMDCAKLGKNSQECHKQIASSIKPIGRQTDQDQSPSGQSEKANEPRRGNDWSMKMKHEGFQMQQIPAIQAATSAQNDSRPFSSGRWRRGWCASATKRLSSNHALKALVPTLCLVVVVIYGLADKLRNFVAGIFIPQYHYPYAVALCFAQLAPPPSIHISVLISIMSGTSFVITASQGLADIEPLEYVYAPLALILHSLSLTWLAKVSEAERQNTPDAQASIFDIYYNQLVNQCWVLGLLWMLHPDSPWQVLSQGSWHSLLFHGYLFAILLLGMLLNFLVGISALSVSPLAAALLYSARQMVQPFFQIL